MCALPLHIIYLCSGLHVSARWADLRAFFNLHYRGFSGEARYRLNVSALLNPFSKARCCWCCSSRFRGALKVLSVQSSEYTMAVWGYVFAAICVFCCVGIQKGASILGSLSHAVGLVSVRHFLTDIIESLPFCGSRVFAFLQSVRLEDRYHSHVCKVNKDNTKTGNSWWQHLPNSTFKTY